MADQLIQQAARLMQEQSAAYARLDAACGQVALALVRGEPGAVESLVREAEGELLKMRSRLVQLMSTLTTFSDLRARAPDGARLSAEGRALFESSSSELLRAARDFERTRQRADALANSASTFVAACIETCGIRPTTYRAPYARRGEVRAWA